MADGSRADRTKGRILSAARSLFAERGYDGTSTRAIAEAAGVAHGTVFRHAPTKEDLVEQLFADDIGAALTRAATRIPSGRFTDVALHFYAAFFAAYGADEALARVLVKELPFLHGDARHREMARTWELFEHLVSDVGARQHAGEIDAGLAPLTVVSTSFSLYYAALVAWLAGQLDRDGAWSLLQAQHGLLERSLPPFVGDTPTSRSPT